MEALEYEVKALHVALEQVQATLTSPELARQSLKEQLAQRQVTIQHKIIQDTAHNLSQRSLNAKFVYCSLTI